MNLKDKKILLLAPCFFGYEKEIQRSLGKKGGEVYYCNVDPSNTFRTIQESLKKFFIPTDWMIRMFEDRVYKKVNHQNYDIIIIVCGWAATSRLTHMIREKLLNKNGRMILYYWDSMERLKDDKKRWDDFDAIYTFDMKDAQEHSKRVRELPLFYCERYWNSKHQDSPKVDGMIIGSFRLDRLDFVRNIRLKNPNINIGSYLYTPKWEILFHKTLRKKYRGIRIAELNYERLSFEEVISMYNSSSAVIDIPALYQNGLTIRTFETMALHKKLITSNKNITNYDFYDPDNIFIIQDGCELPSKEWFEKPFSIADEIIKKYSLERWLDTLLLV